ncbi:BZ3500_MvSof-1268-A1-R1_Chr9g10909 [Microbotryum saponariae]|uniref:BZ3500_MvSof-1268-A1-R1_Chr9g10909 protein n=1 Tax=Microbotryum saponariae TaxID=289078 RepID=A0A2X0L2V8_9BASI|nr:BZ3501_MvSof-1269-A2-R1_Chr9g10657 [Microbotryum saponariae]SDA00901.1 BZ3500_MvSof-1268-A1-R1_Chr9g10909 [Microbotryum saponariae]
MADSAVPVISAGAPTTPSTSPSGTKDSSRVLSTASSALIAGGLAGTAVDTLFFPIDTLKTRAQSQQGFFASGGFTGVYRGLSSAVIGSAPGASAFFTTYETLKTRLPAWIPQLGNDKYAPALHMLSASGGEVAACMIRVPTEVVKQRSQTSTLPTSGWPIARSIWTTSGLSGFYRGFGSTVAREIPFTCLQFPMYERMKLVLARRRTASGKASDLPSIEAAACGSVAGGISAALTTPLDVCKTRIMLSGRSAFTLDTATVRQYPSSMLKTFGIIWREEGVRVLFSGLAPRVAWISMGGAVFLGTFEAVKKAIDGTIPSTVSPQDCNAQL